MIAVPLGILIAPSVAWYVAMIAALLVVLAVEFLNTAIEKLSDHVTPEQHRDIGRIKTRLFRGILRALRLPVWCGSRQSLCAADCSEHFLIMAAMAARLRLDQRTAAGSAARFQIAAPCGDAAARIGSR